MNAYSKKFFRKVLKIFTSAVEMILITGMALLVIYAKYEGFTEEFFSKVNLFLGITIVILLLRNYLVSNLYTLMKICKEDQ